MNRGRLGHKRNLLAALSLGLATACTGDGGPGELGTVASFVIDDPSSQISVIPQWGPYRFAHHKNFGENYYHGTLTGSVQVQISVDGLDFLDAGLPAEVAVPLQSVEAATALRGGSQVPAGKYRYVRIVIEGGEAMLEKGARVGGLDLEADGRLALERGERVELRKQLAVSIDVGPERQALILLDLNTELWVTEDHLLDGTVSAAAIGDALTVGIPLPLVAGIGSRL